MTGSYPDSDLNSSCEDKQQTTTEEVGTSADTHSQSIDDYPYLRPYLTTFVRNPRQVQIGLHPATAVIIDVPQGTLASDINWLLGLLNGTRSQSHILRLWAESTTSTMPETDINQLVIELMNIGVVDTINLPTVRTDGTLRSTLPTQRIHLIGSGMLASLGRQVFADAGYSLSSPERLRIPSSPSSPHGSPLSAVASTPPLCREPVVLCDTMIPDPLLLYRLHQDHRVVLPITMVDDIGWIGSPVLPYPSCSEHCNQLFSIPGDTTNDLISAAHAVGRDGRGSLSTAAVTIGHALALLPNLLRAQQAVNDSVMCLNQNASRSHLERPRSHLDKSQLAAQSHRNTPSHRNTQPHQKPRPNESSQITDESNGELPTSPVTVHTSTTSVPKIRAQTENTAHLTNHQTPMSWLRIDTRQASIRRVFAERASQGEP